MGTRSGLLTGKYQNGCTGMPGFYGMRDIFVRSVACGGTFLKVMVARESFLLVPKAEKI